MSETRIPISRTAMKKILEAYVPRRSKDSMEYRENMFDYFTLERFHDRLSAGYLTITFQKYKKIYTYSFTFHGFPQFIFTAKMTQRIRLTEQHRELY